MPLYHFNVADGHSYPDLVGSELPDLESARIEAVRRSGRILSEQAATFWDGQKWKLNVTDAHGLVMFSLHFSAVSSPATEHYAERLSARH